MRVDGEIREVLLSEAAALEQQIQDPATRSSYAGLARGLADGEVGEAEIDVLERLLDLGLRSGRWRRLHGPQLEAAATRLHQATPAGQAVNATLTEANAALGALHGKVLRRIEFAAKGPGAYSLTLDTDDARITLAVDADGVGVREVSVGT